MTRRATGGDRRRGPSSSLLILADSVQSLLRRPVHTAGMVLGIMLGVAGAACTVIVAQTQQARIDMQFDLQRADHVVITSEDPSSPGFEPSQVSAVSKLEPVNDVGELTIWSDGEGVSTPFGSYSATGVPVVAADPGGLRATQTHVVGGATTDILSTQPANIAWVGEALAKELGVAPAGGDYESEAQIVVAGVPFSVAGTLSSGGGFGYLNRAVIVSRLAAEGALGSTASNVRIVADVRPGAAAAVAEYCLAALNPRGDTPLRDVTPPDGAILVSRVGADLKQFGLALVALVGAVGVITVANTLMTSVYQRSRELGLRSAVGWSRTQIGLLILSESAIAGFLAGVLGSAIGTAAAVVWCVSQGWGLVYPPLLPVVLTAGAVGASLVGGVLPALRAASTSPLVAMRA